MDETVENDQASTSNHIERTMFHDSDYDDALEIPDITINENGEPISTKQDGDHLSNKECPGFIPFSAIYNFPTNLSNQRYNIFIPSEEVHVRIINNERSVTTHPLNPNLYTIELRHGPFVWTIKKRYKHIQHLHNQLKIYRTSLNIPFPTKTHREKRNSFRNLEPSKEKRKHQGILPRFPNKPDVLVPYEQLNHRMKALEDYLNNLFKTEIYKRHPEVVNFMELSHLSFIADLGMKGKEGLVLKRTGSVARTKCNFCGLFEGMCCMRCNHFCASLCSKWHYRHLVIKDTFITYMNPKDGELKSVILMDNAFAVSFGMYTTGLRNGLQLINLNRHVVFKCWTHRQAKEWVEFIQQVCSKEGRDFIQTNPHNSFAPYRSPTPATWFIDGSNYMSAVADALESAKEEIFIADWWLSPEIYMKRPATDGNYWRLDVILQRKALQGVKIFVMIYKEVEVALGINSFYSKQRLVELCPENIKVLRHPDHARVGVFLWAHHEKIVVVDQTIAFLGGIDLCYGRWDNNKHRLTDVGSVAQSSIYIPSQEKTISTSSKREPVRITRKHVLLPLAIATNTIVMATTVTLPVLARCQTRTMRSTVAELSTIELLMQTPQEFDSMKCDTPEPQRKNLFDMAMTTVEKVKNNINIKRKELLNMMYSSNEGVDNEIEEVDTEDEVDRTIQTAMQDEEEFLQRIQDENNASEIAKLWLGKDYTNFIIKDFNDLEKPYQDLVNRSTTPRMPWHDVGVMIQGMAARDIARHFIQRWNAIKIEKAKLNQAYPFLLPKSYKDCKSHVSFIPKNFIHDVKCQVLRSVSSWSAGFLDKETLEQSIQEAYIEAISKAERYIYIENQFFITLATMEQNFVQNRIGQTLLKRILRAHREGAVFRVFVVMPLLPGFEGDVGGPSGTALRAITHWNYASISRGKGAILTKLIEAGISDPSEYITFHGLRNHAILNGTLVTELIYVHSKLMIVDDNTVICGSANINDRSMIATRDSEIAVIIHDLTFVEGRMNHISFPCGKFAGSFRKQLFREHLGLIETDEDIDITDIVKQSFYNDVWRSRSRQNTEIYEEVFHCVPTDKVTNFTMLKQYQDETPLCLSDPILAQEMTANIKGHLVDMPLNFLSDEELKPAASTVEGLMPTALWT